MPGIFNILKLHEKLFQFTRYFRDMLAFNFCNYLFRWRVGIDFAWCTLFAALERTYILSLEGNINVERYIECKPVTSNY